jgi:hypothetical protein
MNWREQIFQEFTPQVAALTLVADPDNLVTEAEVLQEIQARGFAVLLFEDAISFRYVYESQYRHRLEQGQSIELVIIFPGEAQQLNSLPYDLLQNSRQVNFSLNQLFTHLSYSIVNDLDRSYFDDLYQAQTHHNPQNLGDNATKDFILRYVFKIAPEQINQTVDLLLMLLRRHYRGQNLPRILDNYLIQQLNNIFSSSRNGTPTKRSEKESSTESDRLFFSRWPLATIISNRQAFFAFLQKHWLDFIQHLFANSQRVAESSATYGNSASINLPFDHEDIRVYIDNLFIEGYLQPINAHNLGVTTAKLQLHPWVKAGLSLDPTIEQRQRYQKLLSAVNSSVPKQDAKYQEWLKFAQTWAELIVLWQQQQKSNREQSSVTADDFPMLQTKVDDNFFPWVNLHYSSLYNQLGTTPVMVHQIPRFLARYCEAAKTNKVALVVVDGLAFDQWLILQKVLLTQRPQWQFSTEAVFAWIPTITSVSRQAIFAGKAPFAFPNSLDTTAKEANLWNQFWLDQGFLNLEVAYAKGLGEPDSITEVEKIVAHPKVRVVGLVVDTVDKIMHGMQLGTAGMHNQVHQWAEQGFMSSLLNLLLQHNFKVVITSDHGNLEATGIGQPKEGAIADLRGERVRVYPDNVLRDKVKSDFTTAIEWPAIGLPVKYLPLLAPGRTAFIRTGEKIVGHGGISLEELVVPFIQVEG